MKKYWFLIYFAITFFAISCGLHVNNWRSNYSSGGNQASFKKFRGKNIDTITLSGGNTLQLSYRIKISAGSINLYVLHNKLKIWQKVFAGPLDSAVVKIPITEAGKYKIVTEGENASGEFDLGYKEIIPKKVQVKTSRNIELFGLMMQLDMGEDLANSKDTVMIANRKATWREWYIKSYKNYLLYKEFDTSSMMKLFRENETKGFYNDFYIGFLLQVDEVPSAKINESTSNEAILGFSKTGNLEEAKRNANMFLTMFNSFYKEINFEAYLRDNEKYYAMIKADVEKNIPPESFLPAMESFYQKSFDAYYLVPSLNIPTSMGFGKMNGNTKTVYNAFGPFSFQSFDDKNLKLGFDFPEKIQGLSVHEFGHSFVNPAIDKIPEEMRKSTEYLYLPIKDAMSKLAYTNWTMCLYEHFVKAGEVIMARNLGHYDDADKLLNDNVKTKFIYLPMIVEELEKYNKDKERYHSYDDFVPLVLEKLKESNKQIN